MDFTPVVSVNDLVCFGYEPSFIFLFHPNVLLFLFLFRVFLIHGRGRRTECIISCTTLFPPQTACRTLFSSVVIPRHLYDVTLFLEAS